MSRQAFHQREHDTQRSISQSMLVLDVVVALRKEIPSLGTRELYLLLQEPLAKSGIQTGRYELHCLLQDHGLTLRHKRQLPKTTNSNHGFQMYPSLDRGSQYGSFNYIHKVKEAGIAIRMTQHGNPYENAIAEHVNGILKTDFRLSRVFHSFTEAAQAVKESIHNYNHLRPHRGSSRQRSTLERALEAKGVQHT